MRSKWFKSCCILAVALFCLCVVSCSKVTRSNFEKVQEGMTVEEVYDILGEPADSSAIDLKIVSGSAAKWEDEKTGYKITVQFLNGRVKFKQFRKISDL